MDLPLHGMRQSRVLVHAAASELPNKMQQSTPMLSVTQSRQSVATVTDGIYLLPVHIHQHTHQPTITLPISVFSHVDDGLCVPVTDPHS